MPYDIRRVKGGYQVVKKATGEVVAGKDKPITHKGAKGYIWHAENAEGPINKGK